MEEERHITDQGLSEEDIESCGYNLHLEYKHKETTKKCSATNISSNKWIGCKHSGKNRYTFFYFDTSKTPVEAIPIREDVLLLTKRQLEDITIILKSEEKVLNSINNG